MKHSASIFDGRQLPEAKDVEFMNHPSFSEKGTEDALWGSVAEPIEVSRYDLLPLVEAQNVRTKSKRSALTASEERTLFLRYNYAKYRLKKCLTKLKRRKTAKLRQEAELWRSRAIATREKLVHANLPLVPGMARRMIVPDVEFTELISEGYMAVLRCIEKFDISRGYKFSTYACRSILSCFYRLRSKAQTYQKHVPVTFDKPIERSDFDDRRHESQRDGAIDTVRQVLYRNQAHLSEIEARVIDERFPLVRSRKPSTFSQLSKEIGVSSERVRQIEQASLSKIRDAIEELMIA